MLTRWDGLKCLDAGIEMSTASPALRPFQRRQHQRSIGLATSEMLSPPKCD